MNDRIKKFITTLLDPLYYSIAKNREFKNSPNDIYSLITAGAFRKSHVDEYSQIDFMRKIANFVKNKYPIQFSVPFGAYKAWRLGLDFRPDWSEVFNMAYLLRFGTYITNNCGYNVDITYTYSDNIMYFVSDIPRDKALLYVRDFQKLLALFNQINPRVQFHLQQINKLYDSLEEYYIDFLRQFLDNLVFWDIKYDEKEKNKHVRSSFNNLYPFGERRIAEQTVEIQEKYYYYSALMTDAVDCLKERRLYNKGGDKIQIVGVKGPSLSLNMGACETSTVHFWTGRGVLKMNKGVLKPFIYTSSNMDRILEKRNYSEIDVDSPFASISENYNKILFLTED